MKRSTIAVVRTLGVMGIGAALLMSSGQPVAAKAGISISSPFNGQVLRAGPDFATDVLADPWDFDNREDVTMDPAQIKAFSSFTFTGGNLAARATGGGTHFLMLERAYYGILNPGRTGRKSPIDSSVYQKLSFKTSATSGSQFPRVYWFHNELGNPAGDAYGWRYVPENAVPVPAGTRTFVMDMTLFNNPDLNQPGVPWTSGAVKGLAMYPNSSTATNDVTYEWVRLTTADNHPAAAKTTLSWTGSSTGTITVTDAQLSTFTVATNVASGYVWNYGVLPPGAYTLTISQGSLNGTVNFTVNAPPTIKVIDPDETGGEDFATAVLNNPWDMNDQLDTRNDVNIVDHLSASSFSGGRFTGTSDGQTVAFSAAIPVGDPMVYFLSNQKDSTPNPVIDTSRYHRLTFGLTVDRAFDLERGSVARIFWGSASSPSGGGTPYDVTTTKDIITFPGVSSYTLDLAPLNAGPDGGLETGNATAWTARNVRHLRIDPHEFAEQVTFHYDNVKLAADDETANGRFTIRFAASDPDGSSGNIALYYDSDLNPGNGMTLITPGLALTATQYVWDSSQVPNGTYYIYAVASDSLNASGQYSTGPVRVGNFAAPSNPLMAIDSPVPSATVTSAFEVAGWALDRGAATGTGVDRVVFYIFPNNGADPGVYLGQAGYGYSRADVGAAYGTQFTNSAYHFTVTGMTPGTYLLGVYAHSTVSDSNFVQTVRVTVNANTLMSIDVPSPEMTITAPTFGVAGWAIDRRAPSGTGVDTLHVYAYRNPGSGIPPIFLGVAGVGINRSDVAAFYGPQFASSGYTLNVNRAATGLTPGVYNIVVWVHSTVDNSFNNFAVVRVTIQ